MAERAVWPVIVVVVFVPAQHPCGMALVDDQDAVEEFATDRADEAFGDRVGARCLHRRPDDADIAGGEHRVERGGELGVAVAEEELDAAPDVVEVHEKVPGLLGSAQAPVG